MIRKTSPIYPDKPYNWDAISARQCTWYAYYRAIEEGFTPPCWWDRATKTGSYTNAKYWLENYRDPWEVKDCKYEPVHGDIAVFDGNCGHVIFIEEIREDKKCLISDFNRIVDKTFSTDIWEYGTTLKKCGKLLGYLHYPNNKAINTVERNRKVDQILVTNESLRVRLGPTLDSDIYCYAKLGYYNVLSKVLALSSDMDKVQDLDCWYEIEEGKFCSNLCTEYLPNENNINENLENQIRELTNKVDLLTQILHEINDLSKDY